MYNGNNKHRSKTRTSSSRSRDMVYAAFARRSNGWAVVDRISSVLVLR